MKIINKNGFTKSEVERYRRILRDNALRSIQVLVDMAEKKEFKIPKKLQVRYFLILCCKYEPIAISAK